MRSIRIIFYVLSLFGAVPSTATGGAWTLPQGEWFRSDMGHYFTTTDSPNPAFEKAGIRVYLEYGLLDQLTLGVFTDQGARLDGSGFGQQTGRIGALARWRVWQGERDVASLQLGGSFPFVGFQSAAAPGGDRSRQIEVSALFGRAFPLTWGDAWAEAGLGFSNHDRGRSDEVSLDLTFGVRPDDNWVAMLQVFSSFAVENAALGQPDFDAVKVKLSAGRKVFGEKTLLIGISRDIHTRGTDKGLEFSIGFWTHF